MLVIAPVETEDTNGETRAQMACGRPSSTTHYSEGKANSPPLSMYLPWGFVYWEQTYLRCFSTCSCSICDSHE